MPQPSLIANEVLPKVSAGHVRGRLAEREDAGVVHRAGRIRPIFTSEGKRYLDAEYQPRPRRVLASVRGLGVSRKRDGVITRQ